MKSYSPSKVALLSQDYNEGDIPLQDTVSVMWKSVPVFGFFEMGQLLIV